MDYRGRLERLRELLLTLPCDALLIEHSTHLFYLTGLSLSIGKLLITQKESSLIIDGRYFETSSSQTLYPVHLLKEGVLKELLQQFEVHHLGFDQNNTTYQAFLSLTKLAEELKNLSLVPIESAVQKLRMIKDPEEIECLKKAAKLGFQGYEYVVSLLQEGVSEQKLAFELEFYWKKLGASRLAFDSIIAFGSNSSMPHYRAGPTTLQKNTSVLIDIGLLLNHYHSDMTRVVHFGTPSPVIQKIYSIVEEAKEQAFALCRPGTLIGELDHAARSYITSQGYRDQFVHSLGHGIGLDIHEPPTIRETGPHSTLPLQPGMVITIEPGIYLPGIGGVRLEDTIVITPTGYDNITSTQII